MAGRNPRRLDADAYLGYLEQTGLKAYQETNGNLGAACLRRTAGDRAEFLLISLWRSRSAMLAFAGAEAEKAVFYPEDARCSVSKPWLGRPHRFRESRPAASYGTK